MSEDQSLLSQSRRREEVESPGQDKKHFKTEEYNPVLEEMRAMRSMLTKDQERRDEQHKELTGSFDDLKDQVKLVSKAVRLSEQQENRKSERSMNV